MVSMKNGVVQFKWSKLWKVWKTTVAIVSILTFRHHVSAI